MAATRGAAGKVETDLTDEEEAELDAHPVGSINAILPDDRLALRKSAARKLWESVMKSDWYKQRPAEVKAAYEAKPPWQFYVEHHERGTPRHFTQARRLYGVMTYPPTDPDPIRYHTICATPMVASKTIGGISATTTDLEVVDNWNADVARVISTNRETCWLFFDPLSWWDIAMAHDEKAPQTCDACGGCANCG
jgi:hypothetical protein